MRHRRAIEILPDLGTGALDSSTESELIAHSEECPACREWIATRELLASELSQARDGQSHPDAQMLALCVVRPEEVNETDREEFRAHLESCPSCRKELSTMRAAVKSARPQAAAPPRPKIAIPARLTTVTKPLAASLLGALALGSLVLAGLTLDRLRSGGGTLPLNGQSQSVARAVPFHVLKSQTLEGERVIRANDRLMVSDVKIDNGASVTFHAGEVVAFGDGFRVETGARMTAGSGSPGPGKVSRSASGRRGKPETQSKTGVKRGVE